MRLIFTILLTLGIQVLFAQSNCVPKNPLLDFLINSPKDIGTIRNTISSVHLLRVGVPELDNEPQQLVKSSSGLYILIEGTGRVYKFSGICDSLYCFDRVDRTFFAGYNFQAVPFIYKDTLYSFGGYGFWNWNGQLRYFKAVQKEWLVKQINEEVTGSARAFQYTPGSDFLYYIEHPYTDVVTGISITKSNAVVLNLKTGTNQRLGELTKEMRELMPMDVDNFHYMPINMPEVDGIMMNYKLGKQYLLLFNRNEVYQLQNRLVMDAIFQVGNGIYPVNFFHTQDTLYFTQATDSLFKLQKVALSMRDFKKLPIRIYHPESDILMKTEIWIFLLVLMLFITGLLNWKYRRKKRQIREPQLHTNSSAAHDLVFTQVEISLIRRLIEDSKTKNGSTVEDINFALGLGRKSLEVQKKTRTDTINRINHKFRVLTDEPRDLILRVRSEMDKRFYNYVIIEQDWDLDDFNQNGG